MIQVCCTTCLAKRRTQVDGIAISTKLSRRTFIINQRHHRFPLLDEQTDDTFTDIALCIFCRKQAFKKDRKLHKIKTAEPLQNVKDAAEGQNDYNMCGLLSNATFIDKAVYHSGCITTYLLIRTPGKSEPYNSESRRFDNEHYVAFQSLVSDIHEDLFIRNRAFTMTQLHHIYYGYLPDHVPKR